MYQTERWATGACIALELDLALSMLSSGSRADLPPEAQAVPEDWWEEGLALAGRPERWHWSLDRAAWLANALPGSDYRAVTLGIRSLSIADSLQRLANATGMAVAEAEAASPAEQLAELWARWETAELRRLGLGISDAAGHERLVRSQVLSMCRILRDGDLNARFWLWLDQGYFQFYQYWRLARQESMAAAERQAESALGGPGRRQESPVLSWLPPQNALRTYPGFQEAVGSGELLLHAWIDPFGSYDHWFVYPGLLVAAVGLPGEGFSGFRTGAERVADRLKACADPTRLMILRLIRHLSMDNTEMAGYLGVTRQTVSVHAQLLREAGLITSEQRGRQASHAIVPGAVRRLCADLIRFLDLDAAEEG